MWKSQKVISFFKFTFPVKSLGMKLEGNRMKNRENKESTIDAIGGNDRKISIWL